MAAALAGCGGTAQRVAGARPALPGWGGVEQPHGTVFWGGAGLDGGYVEHATRALAAAGMRDIHVGAVDSASWNLGPTGMFLDALRAGSSLRSADNGDWRLADPLPARAGPFNLIGYSYGSLVAAQTAHWYARQGRVVDSLVLIGSPIDAGFLATLRVQPGIRRVIVVDLVEHGDPIRAGMAQGDMTQALPLLVRQMGALRGEGHFHYAHDGPELAARWTTLVRRLVAAGLR